MLLSAIDFWVVKNIVGRKLVKMRWWFIIDNEGNERWWFEHRFEAEILFQDRMVFWGTLWGTPAVWGIFSIMNALTFSIFKTATTGVCMLIAIVQWYAFRNCEKAKERRKKFMGKKQKKKLTKEGRQNKKELANKLLKKNNNDMQ
jgi:hypothetical protein